MNDANNKNQMIKTLAVLLGGIFLGALMFGGSDNDRGPQKDNNDREKTTVKKLKWTCSMHPSIQLDKAGACPLCGMDLIPTDSGDSDSSNAVTLSAYARELAQVEVYVVARRAVTKTIRLVGKLAYDETRIKTLSSRMAGRIDRIFVDYTGVAVKKGEHLFEMYSPDLLAAQDELIQAGKALKRLGPKASASIVAGSKANLLAIREKLRLWGLSQKQIAAIEKQDKATDRMTINAPISGLVIHKDASEGRYFKTGQKLYVIADLSHLWGEFSAYESDLAWLRYGQVVTFETEAYPGEIFSGRITFINPVLDAKTRTVTVRVNVDNKRARLKPEMFIHANVKVNLAEGGKVVDDFLKDKWVSPMHPEIIKDGPGACDVCGMDLVPARSLGLVGTQGSIENALVIPVSAPLITGERAVVYVQDPNDVSRFSGRVIVLGAKVDGYYVVASGLEVGERVVAKGNFKIDSAVQLQAKTSMMNPAQGSATKHHEMKKSHSKGSSHKMPEKEKHKTGSSHKIHKGSHTKADSKADSQGDN